MIGGGRAGELGRGARSGGRAASHGPSFRHGPDAVAFYLSGQLLTEDYYVANKLMKGFIGTANVDTNSRLCMASSVAGHRRAFGADTVPGCYEDLDEADLVVLVGSNSAWCHPVLFQRILKARQARGTRLVVVDPRRTATAEEADLHLAVAAGTDTILFAGLLAHLAAHDAVARPYVEAHTTGFAEALADAGRIAPDAAAVARATGVPAADVAAFFALFAATDRVVTAYSQGVNQSVQGTDKVGAIVNCHLATGRIGRPGTGPLSLTGQPNAMGGREVGGLANMLAAHMGFAPAEIDRVRRFWRAPQMAEREGLKAVPLFEAIEEGRVRALWVMATNPAVSLPRADRVRRALAGLDLLVVSDCVAATDTATVPGAVLLPAAAWGEKDGTVTNSERRISRQRAFATPPGEARPDWWMVCEVARRLGHGAAFAYRTPAEIFAEHAALSAFENDGGRDFDIGGLADLDDYAYDRLAPVQWPQPRAGHGAERFFATGGFFTADGRARFVVPATPRPAAATTDEPFLLNTGRVRDQWHTMTRTGRSPTLGSHRPVPFVTVHPDDARRIGLAGGDLAGVASRHGAAVLEVAIDAAQAPGRLFAPIHWSGETASDARIGAVVHADLDPFSGQPDLKATPVSLAAVPAARRGFVLSRRPLALPGGVWWARVAVESGTGTLLATDRPLTEMIPAVRDALGSAPASVLDDPARDLWRAAWFTDGRLDAVCFLGPAGDRPHWDMVRVLFRAPGVDPVQRRLLLSGRGADGMVDAGPLVCACFGVGLNIIAAAIGSGAATSVETIGQALKAGTNCGSCVPELKRLLRHAHAA
jgi:assimilatory nitrate reductase catalytic subunit